MNLSPEEAKLFFELMWGLQRYAIRRQGVFKDISSPEEYAKYPAEKKIKLRDDLWKSPGLIDDYLKENPESLKTEYQEIVRNWKGFIKGEFFILRHLKNYTIFIANNNQVYGVLGLFDSLEDIIPSDVLPVMTKTVLLPFKSRIIYDGLLQTYSIFFGGGIRSDLNHTYMVAKQKERIITTFESGTGKAELTTHKIVKSWLPQLEEIASSAAKLKGESALQKATFALLRASIEMAKYAETDPDDLDTLFTGERKISKAATRLSNVLDIEAEE